MKILELLRRFLTLGAAGDPEPPDPPDPPDPTDPGDPGDTLDDLLDSVEASTPAKPAKAATDEDERITAANRRAEEAERRAQAAEARAAQSIPAQPAQPDPEFDAEERQLAEAKAGGADENTLKWLRWQINTNRTVRSTTKRADQTLAASRDIADRAEFNSLEATKPKVFKAYSKRVEEAIEGFRRNGQAIPPRKMVLTYLIGQDIMDGKVKPKAKAVSTETTTTTVDRGKLPSARSDVRKGSGGTSERDKRRARLEGQPI